MASLPTSISNQIGDRLRFLSLMDDDRTLLRDFLPAVRRDMPRMLKAFYEHMQGYGHLAAMFQGQQAMDRAGAAQGRHWEGLFSGRFDQEYVDSAQRIGRMHSRIGLAPQHYIGGYSFMLTHLYALAIQNHISRLAPSGAAKKSASLVAALNKAVMLDMDLVISVYLEQNANAYQDKLQTLTKTFEDSLGPLIASLSGQAIAMTNSATSMTTLAHEATEQATAVAAAAEEASVNVQTVATASEELHASVGEISRQVTQSNDITTTAVHAAESTNAAVHELSVAAQKIGDVVSLISNIAGQTNLLALNATIEAARAGDAGKGFAVVASEVKGLAEQTAKATESITAQVTAMQNATQTAIKAIEGIVSTIGTINQIAGTIAAAVEQQGAATQEIARNVQEVATATDHVSSNISGVSRAVGATGSTASEVLTTAQHLGEQAETLRSNVAGFLTKLRAA